MLCRSSRSRNSRFGIRIDFRSVLSMFPTGNWGGRWRRELIWLLDWLWLWLSFWHFGNLLIRASTRIFVWGGRGETMPYLGKRSRGATSSHRLLSLLIGKANRRGGLCCSNHFSFCLSIRASMGGACGGYIGWRQGGTKSTIPTGINSKILLVGEVCYNCFDSTVIVTKDILRKNNSQMYTYALPDMHSQWTQIHT